MDLATLFAVPIASFSHAHLRDMNAEIASLMNAESEHATSLQVSNIGNWHSPNNLHERPEACFQYLTSLIKINARKLIEALAKKTGPAHLPAAESLSMWAMVMRKGHYTKPHTHSNAHWAVVYYPDIGDENKGDHKHSGDIAFTDPRVAHLSIPGLERETGEFTVSPQTGQMLIFPGWLTHYVHPYQGERPRVSVACNIYYA
jgi:uncharacterized protein (TIGR02466 family)